MLKIYLAIVALILLTVFIVGGLIPTLISAASTEAVLLGIVGLVLVPVILFYGIKFIIKLAKPKKQTSEE